MLLWHLLGGGTETTGSLTASVLNYLYEHPEDKQRLIEDPDLLELATEEFIRYFPPAKGHARVVLEDVEVAGCQMKKGEKLLLSWVSANRDEEVFGSDSTRVVLDRFPNRHGSFSYGPHRCPGSHLARESFKEMITHVLSRLPEYRILTDQVTRFPDQSILGGFSRMPAVFPPEKRLPDHDAGGN
jgi:cytochrome P450